MPTKTTPTATVIYDNPVANGRVLLLANQEDYQFAPPKENGAFGGQQYYWPQHNDTEYLPALQCVRPKARALSVDMAGWTIQSGLWRYTRPAVVASRPAFLDYYDNRADRFGTVIDNTWHWPNMAAFIIRQAPAENTTGYGNYVFFEFLGNPIIPSNRSFGFRFPVADPTYKYPLLLQGDAGTTPTDVVAEWNSGQGNSEAANGIEVDELWFEWIDAAWHVRKRGTDDAWVYRPAVTDSVFSAFSPGPVRVTVYGHSALVWFGEIDYPATSYVTQSRYEFINASVFATTRTWHVHSWVPDNNWGTPVSEEANPSDADEFRPVLMFMRDSGTPSNRPPAVFVTSMIAQATHGGISSSPVTLDKDNGYHVESISYELSQTGHNQTCEIIVRDTAGTLPLKGNEKITVTVGWNQDDGTTDTAQKFMGYVQRIEKLHVDDQASTTLVRITVGDPINARLTKKFMTMKSAAGGDDLPNWVWRILWDAGVPSAQLTSIYATIGQGPIIPQGQPKGDLRFQFTPDTCIVDALDQVTEACGYEWGWNAETGLYFLRVPLNTAVGDITPDYTLKETDTAAADIKWEFSHEKSPEDYRNVLYVISETLGEQWSTIYEDPDSRATAADPSYIGDDWWEVATDTDTPQAGGKAEKRWKELLKQHSLVPWSMKGRLNLGPGKFVKMQVTRVGVTTDAIYQVLGERGMLTWGFDQPRFETHHIARIWETS